MGSYNPVPNGHMGYRISDFNNFSRYFMSQDQRNLVPAIPLHEIATTNTAGVDFEKTLTFSQLGKWVLFQPDI
jgi:hypothetical protein